MRAMAIQNSFGLESLLPIELPDPQPGTGQVVIKVHAASLNYRDYMTVMGFYNPKQPLPLVPLSDGAGEIVAVGAGVTRVKVGDRVGGIFTQTWLEGDYTKVKSVGSLGGPLSGMLAEYALLDAEGVVLLPEHLSYEEGATLPCAAVTAWNALITEGNLKAGDTVLVQGTGGVSLFALQFAKSSGARVLITSSSDEKLARAKQLGADAGVNYRTNPDWDVWALAQTGGIGVDHIVEVGGAGTLTKSLNAVRHGGRVSLIGVLTGIAQEINIIPVLMKNIHIKGIYVGSRAMFEVMNHAISQNQIKPVIDHIFPFSEAQQALEHMKSGAHFGKIVIRID